METLTKTKPFIDNPGFYKQRIDSLKRIDYDLIDKPIVEIIKKISDLDFCFTLQSCYGHFIYENQMDGHSTLPLPRTVIEGNIEYRIAYLALCLDNTDSGKLFLENLQNLTLIDKHYIQVGSANWFWEQQVNSFVIQVEPERFQFRDKISIEYPEAIYLEKIRNELYLQINKILRSNI